MSQFTTCLNRVAAQNKVIQIQRILLRRHSAILAPTTGAVPASEAFAVGIASAAEIYFASTMSARALFEPRHASPLGMFAMSDRTAAAISDALGISARGA